MAKEDEDVVTAISDEGDSSVMVCKPADESESAKVCMDVGETKASKNRKGTHESENMLDNNTYNLMEQLTNENKSLWRIKNSYKRDASMDVESRQLWDFIEKDKEELVQLLTERLRERL